MDTLKNPRFWITLSIVIAAGVLAALKVLSGGEFSALVVGMLVRLGADKATKEGADPFQSAKSLLLPFAIAAGSALLVASLLTGCCQSAICYLDRAHTALTAADKIALDEIGKKCMAEAEKCGPVGAPKCPGWQACDAARAKYKAAVDATDQTLAVANRLLHELR